MWWLLMAIIGIFGIVFGLCILAAGKAADEQWDRIMREHRGEHGNE